MKTRTSNGRRSTHRLVELLDADHRERVVAVLEELAKPTQRQLKRRVAIITQLDHLGYFGGLLFKRAYETVPKSGA